MTQSVVICCSQRFKEEVAVFRKKLGECGVTTVFMPNFRYHRQEQIVLPEHERIQNKVYAGKIPSFVYDHLFRKVAIADVCYIYNRDGYIGANTLGELFAAAAWGKPCYSFDRRILMGTYPDDLHEEPAPLALLHDTIESPEELAALLGVDCVNNDMKDMMRQMSRLSEEIGEMRRIMASFSQSNKDRIIYGAEE